MILLREFAEDFDKVITMSKETFIERAKQRNDYNPGPEGTEGWKNSLDTAISKIDKSKLILTNKYLSDLLGSKPNIIKKNPFDLVDPSDLINFVNYTPVTEYNVDDYLPKDLKDEQKPINPNDTFGITGQNDLKC